MPDETISPDTDDDFLATVRHFFEHAIGQLPQERPYVAADLDLFAGAMDGIAGLARTYRRLKG